MKEALTETFAEQSDLLCEVVTEALEDFALAEAIEEGQQTGKVSRVRIFDTLEGAEREDCLLQKLRAGPEELEEEPPGTWAHPGCHRRS